MMKRCDKPGCNILYNEVYQTPVKEKTDNDIIRGYLYEIIRREKLKNNNYDLVITDIEMPHLNGFDFAKKVRQELQKDDLTIIALSTRFSEEDKKKEIEKVMGKNILRVLEEIYN